MNLAQALRYTPPASIALAGSGGKTTLLFQLARELGQPVIVAATSHMHIDQLKLADLHWIVSEPRELAGLGSNPERVTLVTGPVSGERTLGLDDDILVCLHEFCQAQSLPLLIEADGSRQHPLKAPTDHEPPIPDFVDMVVVVAGLSSLGKPLSTDIVYNPDGFSTLGRLAIGELINPQVIANVLNHPNGGLKNIPVAARRVALLNQCDTSELQSVGQVLSEKLIPSYHAVVIASIKGQQVHSVHESTAGIILAAGEGSRFGQPKQLLDYKGQPFVRRVALAALASGLSPVVLVTGAHAKDVQAVVEDLPIIIAHNTQWTTGQSSSIRVGLHQLPAETGAAIFLLADQPQVSPPILRALVGYHARNLAPILVPMIRDQRANPVLFDRLTFPVLNTITGDVGGRAIFPKYPLTYLPWLDEALLIDIDTPEELAKLEAGA
jgi:molybdenum cofactor cytidylyltransferase